ncbi:bacteriohemerythrin [Pseudomonadota bacterium]
MTTFIFDESMHVGNRLMDREHAVLIEYINTLQSVVDGNSSRFLVGQVLEGLVEYTKTHFYIEEELMVAFSYSGYMAHKSAHDKFRLTMSQWVEQHKSGEVNITEEVMSFLKSWLIDHIQNIDAKLAGFLKGKTLG